MTTFGALHTSGSGMRVYRTWLDAVSDNIANAQTVRRTTEEAFRSRYVVAEAAQYGRAGGARVAGIVLGDPQGRLVHDPEHPLADQQGMVRHSDVDMGAQMVQLLVAQRGYQANIAVLERVRAAYERALELGR